MVVTVSSDLLCRVKWSCKQSRATGPSIIPGSNAGSKNVFTHQFQLERSENRTYLGKELFDNFHLRSDCNLMDFQKGHRCPWVCTMQVRWLRGRGQGQYEDKWKLRNVQAGFGC